MAAWRHPQGSTSEVQEEGTVGQNGRGSTSASPGRSSATATSPGRSGSTSPSTGGTGPTSPSTGETGSASARPGSRTKKTADMIAHVVLFAPRPGLSHDEQQAFLTAFEHAVTNIPSVQHVRLGRRVRHGAGYEGRTGAAEFVATIAFDDLAGLRAYLEHPAHEELGRQFGTQLAFAEVYDFEDIALEQLARSID